LYQDPFLISLHDENYFIWQVSVSTSICFCVLLRFDAAGEWREETEGGC